MQQTILGLVLALLIFSVALELRPDDFRRVARTPRAVAAGLLPQFVLLPLATWLATLVLELPAPVEVAMILVAAAPGGTTASVFTHLAGGNAALSMSVSAVGAVLSVLLTPLNFGWMVAANPVTASWFTSLSVDPRAIAFTLVGLLGLPLAAGMAVAHRWPALAARWRRPLARLALGALVLFILAGLVLQRHLLDAAALPLLALVIAHNGAGLLLANGCARALRLPEADRRAVVMEGGLQNAGLALGIVALQFGSQVQMVVFTGLWGVWHSVSALALVGWWRRGDGRSAARASTVAG